MGTEQGAEAEEASFDRLREVQGYEIEEAGGYHSSLCPSWADVQV